MSAASVPVALGQSAFPQGRWEGPYDLSLNNPPSGSNATYGEIAHAAMVFPKSNKPEVMFWPVTGYCCADPCPGAIPPYQAPSPCPSGMTMSTYTWLPGDPHSYDEEIVLPYTGVGTDMFCNGFAYFGGALVGAGGTLWSDSCSFWPGGTCGSMPPGWEAQFSGHSNVWMYSTSGGGVWLQLPSLLYGRWYPTVVELPDGNLIAFGDRGGTHASTHFEIFNGSMWTPGPGNFDVGQYPRVHVLASGLLILTGYTNNTRFLDLVGAPAQGWFQPNPPLNSSVFREEGCSVYLRRWNPATGLFTESIFIVGGRTPGVPLSTGILSSAERIDDPAPGSTSGWTLQASMTFARREFNLCVLPTGDIVAIGGERWNPNPAPGALEGVMVPEILHLSGTLTLPGGTPAPLGQWIPMLAHTYERRYHSVAFAHSNGTVVVAGGRENLFPPATSGHSVEVFYPPYLYHPTPAPTLVGPAQITYGQNFSVTTTPGTGTIAKVTMLRPPAVTHSFDFNQRYLELEFNGNQVSAPATPNIAPPGRYFMFVVNSAGVPSIGQTIWIQ